MDIELTQLSHPIHGHLREIIGHQCDFYRPLGYRNQLMQFLYLGRKPPTSWLNLLDLLEEQLRIGKVALGFQNRRPFEIEIDPLCDLDLFQRAIFAPEANSSRGSISRTAR